MIWLKSFAAKGRLSSQILGCAFALLEAKKEGLQPVTDMIIKGLLAGRVGFCPMQEV